ncbi:MAG: hypothetical protein EP330_25720 [Deltaproteobacteria bacterium]|nr:MAG: hypothetical protein EP330_25720 [Deltaproteobacteria bacterium]
MLALFVASALALTPLAGHEAKLVAGVEGPMVAPGGAVGLEVQAAPCLGERCPVQVVGGLVVDHLGSLGQRNTRFMARVGIDTPYVGVSLGLGVLGYARGPSLNPMTDGSHRTGLGQLWVGKYDVVYALVGIGGLPLTRVPAAGYIGVGTAMADHRVQAVLTLPGTGAAMAGQVAYDYALADATWVGAELGAGQLASYVDQPGWRAAFRLTRSIRKR